ncbi:MAG: UvrD-helicase domain-containing protein [Bacteroidales bacterium]|nr:UvrD-helicase domain-containing protein [Bacteroidales bacterium]
MKDILSGLNQAQKEAVINTDGPVMVIAGAGSGKTRVLTYRIAHLLQKGIDPFNVLSLTFTNKAAREMKDRISQLIGPEAQNVWMGTFHSIFSRILRIDGHLLGYPSNFTIYDTDDAKSLLKSIVKEQNLDPKVYAANVILNRISSCKNNLISAKAYITNKDLTLQDKMAGKPMIGNIYNIYDNRLFKSSAMDFDDLLFKTNILLRDHPEILYKYQQKFKYILVDEYQDTNYSQYLIVKKLAANNENICVVGDDAQSIYGFRGANIENILNFKKDYPDTKTFKLEQNYRSTQTIVNAANSIIACNKDQIQKEVWTSNPEGEKIPIYRATTDSEEGTMVASSIFEAKMNQKLDNSSFAILYRTNAQSRSLEEALRKSNIPYRIFGGLSFYRRKEIKDILAYFRLTINQNDEEALHRVINYPARGIGNTTMQRVVIAANDFDVSPWEIVCNPDKYRLQVNIGTKNKIGQFATMIQSFSAQLKSRDAYDLAKHIATTSGILKGLFEDRTPEGVSRFENIEEILNGIKEFSEGNKDQYDQDPDTIRSLDMFMQDVALLTDADEDDKDNNDKVSLMTIHSAKGLEFPYVYVVGLEENLFPSIQSLNNRADLEEERRLFYVALTRAEQKVHISYAENRYKWGNLTYCEASRFLSELNTEYIEMARKVSPKPAIGFSGQKSTPERMANFQMGKQSSAKGRSFMTNNKSTNPQFEASEPEMLKAGMNVEHQRFGAGVIEGIDGVGSNRKATVLFQSLGRKQLLLKFAKLKILN